MSVFSFHPYLKEDSLYMFMVVPQVPSLRDLASYSIRMSGLWTGLDLEISWKAGIPHSDNNSS